MRVVVTALRGEVVAELRPPVVAHPRVVVGVADSVQLPARGNPRRDGRGLDVWLAGGLRHGTDPIATRSQRA